MNNLRQAWEERQRQLRDFSWVVEKIDAIKSVHDIKGVLYALNELIHSQPRDASANSRGSSI